MPALGAGGREFESLIRDHSLLNRTLTQLVECHAYTVNVGGSNPSRPTINLTINLVSCILASVVNKCDCGEIGRRKGLKIPRLRSCQFDSGQSHHYIEVHFRLVYNPEVDIWERPVNAERSKIRSVLQYNGLFDNKWVICYNMVIVTKTLFNNRIVCSPYFVGAIFKHISSVYGRWKRSKVSLG